jgi:uncharacterized short protein YbdD (DUF466 family)
MLTRFPLCWPDGWRRTPTHQQRDARFKRDKRWLTISDGVGRVMTELEKMNISYQDVIISTNVRTRLDGLPRSGEPEPSDKGVAVYWRKGRDGQMQCMAIDIYTLVADNLGAVAATLEAMRAIERHGGAQVQERTFRGFAALPEKTGKSWRLILGLPEYDVTITRMQVEEHYRARARQAHPDTGGSHEAMAELNRAREEALKEVGN